MLSADGQGVDARGDRERDQHEAARGVGLAAGVAARCRPPRASCRRRSPSSPKAIQWSHDADIGRQDVAAQPAENRHHELKEAEMEGDAERVARSHPGEAQPGGHGHRQRVHGQPDGDAQHVQPTQESLPRAGTVPIFAARTTLPRRLTSSPRKWDCPPRGAADVSRAKRSVSRRPPRPPAARSTPWPSPPTAGPRSRTRIAQCYSSGPFPARAIRRGGGGRRGCIGWGRHGSARRRRGTRAPGEGSDPPSSRMAPPGWASSAARASVISILPSAKRPAARVGRRPG